MDQNENRVGNPEVMISLRNLRVSYGETRFCTASALMCSAARHW